MLLSSTTIATLQHHLLLQTRLTSVLRSSGDRNAPTPFREQDLAQRLKPLGISILESAWRIAQADFRLSTQKTVTDGVRSSGEERSKPVSVCLALI